MTYIGTMACKSADWKRMCMIVLFSAILLFGLLAGCGQAANNGPYNTGSASTSVAEPSASYLESYLKGHPADERKRVQVIKLYGRPPLNVKRLRYHTFQLIKYHPSNPNIYFWSSSAFYIDPKYRAEVISRLEGQLRKGHTSHHVYWVLARTCDQGAIPPTLDGPEDRAAFMEYNMLPKNTRLPSVIDQRLAKKAIAYYRLAIRKCGGDPFWVSFYSEQLADLMLALGRVQEATTVCRKALPYAEHISRPQSMVTYGWCLEYAGKLAEAKKVLEQVRACDKGGENGGPGYCTTEAETDLGLIALKEGKPHEAAQHLVAASKVQRCCQSMTSGLPLTLARKLLSVGQTDAVITYCRTALSDFCPGQKDAKELLNRALAARGKPVEK